MPQTILFIFVSLEKEGIGAAGIEVLGIDSSALLFFFFLLNTALIFVHYLHLLSMANELFAQAVSQSSSNLSTYPHCGT